MSKLFLDEWLHIPHVYHICSQCKTPCSYYSYSVLRETGFSSQTAIYYKVFCRLAKLIQVKSATLQRFQLAFKHLLLLEENSRLHPIFQDFAFNFHTFSRSGKVVRKFPYFFKNSRLCTNPAITTHNNYPSLCNAFLFLEGEIIWFPLQRSINNNFLSSNQWTRKWLNKSQVPTEPISIY